MIYLNIAPQIWPYRTRTLCPPLQSTPCPLPSARVAAADFVDIRILALSVPNRVGYTGLQGVIRKEELG
jgi:hypothetical protein